MGSVKIVDGPSTAFGNLLNLEFANFRDAGEVSAG